MTYAKIIKQLKKLPGIIYGLVIIIAFFGVTADYFLTFMNMMNILKQASVLIVVSLGMTLAILLGKIDMSVGSTMSLVGVVTGICLHKGISIPLAICIGMAVGSIIGFINGYLIGYRKFDYWIVTFSNMGIAQSLALVITNGATIPGFDSSFRFLGDGQIYGVPVGILIAMAIALAIIYLSYNTKFGSNIYAVGGNEQVARYSGIDTSKVIFKTYILSSLLAGFAGILLVSKVNSANPIAGSGYEFDAIAATLIGGTPFDGGRGGVLGTIIGACIIATLRNGLNMLGLTPPIQFTLVGFIIILIIIFDVLNEKYKAKKGGAANEA
ncbi:ABC transporter permease [Tepidanaerobacter sp. GT38]|uniref:ABC transporter permease n=1 Tax=Tepidanaerobacter sp. GT38 TaxID=2722793 RepID=UPI001F2D5AEA|nr:ABC transporter permease [Tepidanaerobacter sp. GT38]MCG1011593.1 ABC transporter permease [Tepidanaerobacter sp. GT38]